MRRDVEVAVLAGERQLAGEVGADDVAVEHRDRAPLGLQLGDQGVGDRGLAGAGEAGQEDGDAGCLHARQCLRSRADRGRPGAQSRRRRRTSARPPPSRPARRRARAASRRRRRRG